MKEIRLSKDCVRELGNPQEIKVIVDEGYNLMLIKAHVNTKICFKKIDMSKKAHPIGEVINQFIRRLKHVGEAKIYVKDSETDDGIIFTEKGEKYDRCGRNDSQL